MSTKVSSANLNLQFLATIISALGTLGNSQFPLSILQQLTFADGTGAGKANQLLVAQGTLAATAHVDIDVYANGAAVDAVGNAITMTAAKLFIIQNLGVVGSSPVESDSMSIGGTGSTDGLTSLFGTNADLVKINGGEIFLLGGNGAAGHVVGSSTTNHKIRLAGIGANTITYNMVVIGATA